MTFRQDKSHKTIIDDAAALSEQQRYRATRLVALASIDAADCALLLSILGLDAADGMPTANHNDGQHIAEAPEPTSPADNPGLPVHARRGCI
jgi:hypothetical protein